MKRKIKNLLGTIFDIFFWFVLLACIATSVVVATSTSGGSAFRLKLFGVVQSPSMEASGLYVGDVVFVQRSDEYAVGDVIVFYRAPTQYDEWAKDAKLDGVSVWVHEIIDEKTDELGRKTFLTKGSSNAADDVFYVPQDFVLGKAKTLPTLFRAVFKFAVSPAGIISLIVTPSAILFILFTLDLIYLLTKTDEEDEEKTVLPCSSRRKTQRTAVQTTPPLTPILYGVYPIDEKRVWLFTSAGTCVANAEWSRENGPQGKITVCKVEGFGHEWSFFAYPPFPNENIKRG